MIRIAIGIFIILHGLVHLLYFALSRKLVELDRPLVGWPERSWAFSGLLADSTTRQLASVLYIVATVVFVVSGIGILFNLNWWNPVLIGAAVFASAITLLFWDGTMRRLPDKGFVGLLINVALLAAVFLLNRFSIAF